MKIDKLLSIDDDEVNNYIVSFVLKDSQIVKQFEFRLNGERALQYLESCDADQTFPQLILVDLNMPIMDGFQFIQQYEAQFRHKYPNTQLMVLTSSVRETEKQKAMHFASVTSFLNKPLDHDKLATVVQLFHQHRETNGR